MLAASATADTTAATDSVTHEPEFAAAAAEAALAQVDRALEAPHASTWDYVAAKYRAACTAEDALMEFYQDASGRELDIVQTACTDVHQLLMRAANDLLEEAAPNWPALGLRADLLLRRFGDPQGPARWETSAKSFIETVNEIGEVDPADVGPVEVLKACGFAEQLAFRLARYSDGYQSWALNGEAIPEMSRIVERIMLEARALGRASTKGKYMGAEAIDAVWFGKPECPVEVQSLRFADAVVRHSKLDGQADPSVSAQCDAEWKRMLDAEEAGETLVPTSPAGVAFQLLCAAGELDTIECGSTPELQEEAGQKVRNIIANAIKVLGLPYDRKTGEYFLGERLAEKAAG